MVEKTLIRSAEDRIIERFCDAWKCHHPTVPVPQSFKDGVREALRGGIITTTRELEIWLAGALVGLEMHLNMEEAT